MADLILKKEADKISIDRLKKLFETLSKISVEFHKKHEGEILEKRKELVAEGKLLDEQHEILDFITAEAKKGRNKEYINFVVRESFGLRDGETIEGFLSRAVKEALKGINEKTYYPSERICSLLNNLVDSSYTILKLALHSNYLCVDNKGNEIDLEKFHNTLNPDSYFLIFRNPDDSFSKRKLGDLNKARIKENYDELIGEIERSEHLNLDDKDFYKLALSEPIRILGLENYTEKGMPRNA